MLERESLKRFEKITLVAMLGLNGFLTVLFVSKTGFKTYVAIFALMSFAWSGGIYLAFKRGYMLGRGVVISRHNGSREFYINVGVILVIYFLMLGMFFFRYLQEIGYLSKTM